MTIEEMIEKMENVNVSDTHLYFITRILKANIKKAAKVMDKFDFKLYQIDVDDDIRRHLYELTKDQLANLIAKKSDIETYDPITEDVNLIFTYSMVNKAMSFSDVVQRQLNEHIPKIKKLDEIIANEELWAYCVGFNAHRNDWLYTFRKILAGKVAIDEQDGNKRNIVQKTLRTIFNSRSQKLELIEGETVSLDKQIDCLFYGDTFYIARKTQFEQIVGLTEEFKEIAIGVVDELRSTGMIKGLDVLDEAVADNPSIHKKLVKISKLGNYKTLSKTVLNKMVKVAKLRGDRLKVKDGRLVIEDEIDIDVALRMLADYYKLGEVSGKSYGTYAGKQLDETS